MKPGRDDTPAGAGPRPDMIWSVRRRPYLLLAVIFLASSAALGWLGAAASEATALVALIWIVFAVPGLAGIRVLLRPKRFRLSGEALELVGGSDTVSIPLSEIIGIYPARAKSGPVEIVTAARRVTLPRWLSVDGKTVRREIVRRLGSAHALAHAPRSDAGENPWPRYDDVPADVVEAYRELRNQGSAESALLFRGPLRKFSLGARAARRFFLFLTAVGVGITVSVSGEDPDAGVGGVIMVAFGLALFGLCHVSLTRFKGDQWLLVSPEGIVMMGKSLTGELAWEEVREITALNARAFMPTGSVPPSTSGERFFVVSADGARIPIVDVYDAPISVIRQAAVSYQKE